MDVTATTMAKDFKIPYNRLKYLLWYTSIKENKNFGFWEKVEINYTNRRGHRRSKDIWAFYYDVDKVKQELGIQIIRCGRAVSNSKKTRKYLIRNHGV